MVRQFTSEELGELVKMSDITAADIGAYYGANQAEFSRPAQVRASHILFKTAAEAEALEDIRTAIAADRPKARDIFAGFIAQLSTDGKTSNRQGTLGSPVHHPSSVRRTRRSSPVPWQPHSKSRMSGTWAKVIKTSQGFHVIQKTYRRPYRRNLSDVQDKIRELSVSGKETRA